MEMTKELTTDPTEDLTEDLIKLTMKPSTELPNQPAMNEAGWFSRQVGIMKMFKHPLLTSTGSL